MSKSSNSVVSRSPKKKKVYAAPKVIRLGSARVITGKKGNKFSDAGAGMHE